MNDLMKKQREDRLLRGVWDAIWEGLNKEVLQAQAPGNGHDSLAAALGHGQEMESACYVLNAPLKIQGLKPRVL